MEDGSAEETGVLAAEPALGGKVQLMLLSDQFRAERRAQRVEGSGALTRLTA
jgi:hypothetical protein